MTNTYSPSDLVAPIRFADPVVEEVAHKLLIRSHVGIQKYGTTMERTDLSELDWLIHAQEEAMDLAVYLQRLIREKAKSHP